MSMLQTKRSIVVLLFVGLLAGAGAPSRAAAQQKQPQPAPPAAEETEPQPLPRRVAIRFLTDSDYPPFNYYDEDNVLTGFNVDIARSICLELAAACDIQVRAWPELLPALRRGEADAVIASHAVSANALKAVDFTDRYYHTPARFAGQAHAPAVSTSPRKGSRARRSPSPREPRTRPICARSSATARSAPTSRTSLPATRSSAARPTCCSTTASASPSGSTARPPRPAASSRADRSASPSTSATGWPWP